MNELVAVSGAEGFIGSHVVELLVAKGYRVRAMALYNSFGNRGWLDALGPATMSSVEVYPGDVRDARSALGLVEGANAVYHLAALVSIPYSYKAPASYLETNALGTLNILEAVRHEETPRLVHTSTSEVYGSAQTVPIDERHPLHAQSPYAASKIAADQLVQSYHLSFGIPAVTLRPFNTYGPRQSARAVIPSVISQLAAGRHTVHLGSTTPTRDFNFVEDTAAAFVAVGTAPAERVVGRVLNAASGREVSVGALVRIVGMVMGCSVEISEEEERLRPPASEVNRLVGDSGALRALTGWSPMHSLEDGLALTVKWMSAPAHLGTYRVDEYAV
ncbi:MAG: GDP-mannose 4,6-dehydratase [Actinomycetota bacterium]|nr:GDP-mannose 4,6-dehydratase [Actinomycetota bacterium]